MAGARVAAVAAKAGAVSSRKPDETPVPLYIDDREALPWAAASQEAHDFERTGDLDGLLAHWGRVIWTTAKDEPDYDEAARAVVSDIVERKIDRYVPIEALMFAAVWAVDAFQRITTTHTFAAALMCSDPDRASLEALEKQWRAVMIVLPNGIFELHDDKGAVVFEMTRILVSVDDASAKMIFMYPIMQSGVTVWAYARTSAPTLADLLVDPPDDSYKMDSKYERRGSEEYHIAELAQRLVAGLFLAMQAPENFKERLTEPKPPSKSKRTPGAPAHRLIHVGRPLTIDLRAQVKDYIAHGPKRKGHGPPTVQTLVRGHYRRQPWGPGSLQRKVIWIEPFWRGPEEAIISVRPKKLSNED